MGNRHMVDWTEELISEVVSRWNRGDSAATIGRALHMSREAVIGKVHRLRKKGVDVRDGDPTFTPVNYGFVRYAGAREVPVAWTEEQADELAGLWNSGMGERDIAETLNRSIPAVKSKLARLDDLGLILRGAARAALKPKPERQIRVAATRKDKGQKEGRPQSFGVRAISFRFKRDEARISSNTEAGLRLITRMEQAASGTGTPIEELKFKQCRFPTGGSQPQWLFCGNEIEQNVKSSYCAACRPRAFAGLHVAQSATGGPHDRNRRNNRCMG